jgi:flagellar operon protein
VFRDVLAGKLVAAGPLKFSGHALDRIQRRGIDLGQSELVRLQEGVARAAAKGGRDSLVLVDGTAFVVSVPNRTVITAVDRDHMREQVFTNIDSAVIA